MRWGTVAQRTRGQQKFTNLPQMGDYPTQGKAVPTHTHWPGRSWHRVNMIWALLTRHFSPRTRSSGDDRPWWSWGRPCGQHLGNEEHDGHPAAMGSPSVCPLLLGPFALDLSLPALEKLVPVFKLCSESHCKNSAFSTRENSTTPGNHRCLQSHRAAWLCIPCRGSGSCVFILGQMWNKRDNFQRFVPTDISSKQIRIQAVQRFTKTLETSANKFSNILYLEYSEQIAWWMVLDQSLLELCRTWNHTLQIYLNIISYELKSATLTYMWPENLERTRNSKVIGVEFFSPTL